MNLNQLKNPLKEPLKGEMKPLSRQIDSKKLQYRNMIIDDGYYGKLEHDIYDYYLVQDNHKLHQPSSVKLQYKPPSETQYKLLPKNNLNNINTNEFRVCNTKKQLKNDKKKHSLSYLDWTIWTLTGCPVFAIEDFK
jgi:hypothetical protein